jgi:signal transduction histidine kinase
MNKSIVLGIFLYVFSLFILLFGLYAFLESHTFSKENFFMGSAFILMVSLVFGYILNSHALSQKFEIDKNLLHLTQEILHELNIPLATIQANTTLLKRTLKENEKALVRLSRIDASTLRLERLYAELVYGIKKEIHPIDKEVFDVSKLVEERVDTMRLLKRNPFVLSLDSFLIKSDKIGFEKVLDNLLTNAMKYSDKSEVIEIVLKDGILSVHDKGIGMDETELVKVYERYYQLDKHVQGEGIGLALVKAYCDDEKIALHISSEKGKGSTFTLDLKSILF